MGNIRNAVGGPSQATDSSPDDSDQALIQRVKAGEEAAFEVLFRRHMARVHRQAITILGNATEAEEVVQEVFLTVYTKASQLRYSRMEAQHDPHRSHRLRRRLVRRLQTR